MSNRFEVIQNAQHSEAQEPSANRFERIHNLESKVGNRFERIHNLESNEHYPFNDPDNPQHYRYKWIKEWRENHKKKTYDALTENTKEYRDRKIIRSDWKDNKTRILETHRMDEFNFDKSVGNVAGYGTDYKYDVPWYIDVLNLGGLLSGRNNPIKNIWGDKENE